MSKPSAVEQNQALADLQRWVSDNKFDVHQLNPFAVRPALTLLRYLRANGFDVMKSIEHMQRNKTWRSENEVNDLTNETPEAILGLDSMEELTKIFPHWHCGYDKCGRPVLYKQYAHFDVEKIKALVGLDRLARYHIWEQELCLKLCTRQSRKLEMIVETTVAVLDLEGMKISQVTSEFISMVKSMAQIDQTQYAETLGKIYIINAPTAFPFVWRMVKGFLDPSVAAKISIHSSSREWQPVLFESIGSDNMPSTYGGSLGALDCTVHPYAESVANLAAAVHGNEAADRVLSRGMSGKSNQLGLEINTSSPLKTLGKKKSSSFKVHQHHHRVKPEQFPYPAGSPGHAPINGGYWHKLTPAQHQALTSLQREMKDGGVDVYSLNQFALHPVLTLLRYLRANGFDVMKSIEHMQRNKTWRSENEVNDLTNETPEAILGLDSMEELTKIFPHWHCGYDKCGRPVLYKQYAHFDVEKIKALVGLDRLARYHIWEQEQCLKLCSRQSRKLEMIVETTVAVLDLEGMKISQVTSEFISMVKSMAQIDQTQYAETLGKIYIINAPTAFPFVWRMVKGFLDPSVAAKISIHSSSREWQPVLFESIGSDNMPSTYGGSLGALDCTVHPYAESMSVLNSNEGLLIALEYERSGSEELSGGSPGRGGLSRGPRQFSRKGYPSLAGGGPAVNEEEEEKVVEPISSSALLRHHRLLASSDSDAVADPNRPFDELIIMKRRSPVEDRDEYESSEGHLYVDAFESDRLRDSYQLHREDSVSSLSMSTITHRLQWLENIFKTVSTRKLRMYLVYGVAMYTLCALVTMILSAYVVSSKLWVSGLAKLQLWTGVVMLLAACTIIFVNFMAIMGIHHNNRALLVLYTVCTSMGTLIFLVISLACFLYAYVPSIAGLGDRVLIKTFPDPAERERAHRLISDSQVILGSASLAGAVLSLVPILLTWLVVMRLGRMQTRQCRPQQLRVALRCSQCISLIGALVMLSYGGTSITYLMRVNFSPTIFQVYGLIYGGITMVLSSIFGIWTSLSRYSSVMFTYYAVVLPFVIILLISAAAVSFGAIPQSGVRVDRFVSVFNLDHSNRLKLIIQTQLLVTGVLCFFACVFQFVSLVTARSLYKAIVKERSDEDAIQHRKMRRLGLNTTDGEEMLQNEDIDLEAPPSITLNKLQKFIVTWACAYGIFNIYFNGTYAIMSKMITSQVNKEQSTWINVAWYFLSLYDKRFVQGDVFVVSSAGILACLVGPLLLLYAWSTFVKLPFRHIVGILANGILLYTQLLYYAIEIRAKFANFTNMRSAVFVFIFLFSTLFNIIIPSYLLFIEVVLSNRITETHYDVNIGDLPSMQRGEDDVLGGGDGDDGDGDGDGDGGEDVDVEVGGRMTGGAIRGVSEQEGLLSFIRPSAIFPSPNRGRRVACSFGDRLRERERERGSGSGGPGGSGTGLDQSEGEGFGVAGACLEQTLSSKDIQLVDYPVSNKSPRKTISFSS